MRTEHVLRSREASAGVADLADPVDLVVTSPPYPMIEMWDDAFAARDPSVADALDRGDGDRAFESMHEQLDAVWDTVVDALAPGGVVCVNVGDATRSLDGRFRQYPNRARITRALTERGLDPLPGVVWRKPANSAAKFMGSGTLPTNAYVTLEHEYVLVFRKGGPRSFPPGDRCRYESAYFWEERNEWFSDLWEIRGTPQALAAGSDARERSAAFPLTLPLRLVRMYSVRGDTVLDPFAGTATTALAAMLAGRSSRGFDLDDDLLAAFDDRLADLPARSRRRARARLARHAAFAAGRDTDHEAVHYDFGVVTEAERSIRLYEVAAVDRAGTDPWRYEVDHDPVTETPPPDPDADPALDRPADGDRSTNA